jgi:type I restriction enzyme R subunit
MSDTFSNCQQLIRQTRYRLKIETTVKSLLTVSGGVVFTTIQTSARRKGGEYPKLSDRRNIVVVTFSSQKPI